MDSGAPSPSIDIAGRKLGGGEPVYTIAEIGANHDRVLARARELCIDARAQSDVFESEKEDSQAGRFAIQGAGWAGASKDGESVFTGSAGAGGGVCRERPLAAEDGGAVWGERGQRGEMVATF